MWEIVSWPGMEPETPALGAQSLSHWSTREVPGLLLILIFIVYSDFTSFSPNDLSYSRCHPSTTSHLVISLASSGLWQFLELFLFLMTLTIKKKLFGHAVSSLPRGLFSSCGERELLFCWGPPASHCGCLFSHRAQALEHSGFSTCSTLIGSVVVAPQLQSTSSALVAQRLSYPEAVGSSRPRDQTCLLHWQVDSLPPSHQGSPDFDHFEACWSCVL